MAIAGRSREWKMLINHGSTQKISDTDRAESIKKYIVREISELVNGPGGTMVKKGAKLNMDLHAAVLRSSALSDACKAKVLFCERGDDAFFCGRGKVRALVTPEVCRGLRKLYDNEQQHSSGDGARSSWLPSIGRWIAKKELELLTPRRSVLGRIVGVILALFRYITSCFTPADDSTENDPNIMNADKVDDVAAKLDTIQAEKSLANSSSESLSSLTSEARLTGHNTEHR